MGFGINTSFMNIEFGRATYHLAGSSTNVSLILRPDLFYKNSAIEGGSGNGVQGKTCLWD